MRGKVVEEKLSREASFLTSNVRATFFLFSGTRRARRRTTQSPGPRWTRTVRVGSTSVCRLVP